MPDARRRGGAVLAARVGMTALAGLAALGLAATATQTAWSADNAPGSGPHTLKLTGIDPAVRPGDDFFAYANGQWVRTTEIPPDRSTFGPDSVLVEQATQRVDELMRKVVAGGAQQAEEARKAGDYYASFMDEAAIEKKGLTALQPELAAIAAIADRHDLARALGKTLRADVDALNNTQFHTANLFGLWVAKDLDDPARYSPFLLQGGLGLPDRDFYLNPSAHMAAIRDKYRAHLTAILTLAHVSDPQATAGRVFDLEHRIAEVHWSRADSEQVRKANNRWPRAELAQRAPGLDWQSFLSAAGLAEQPELVAWQPSAITGIAALVGSEPLQTWKDFLTAHAIEHASRYLPKAFVDEQFAFYGGVLAGTPQLQPRWKRAVSSTNEALGFAVGKLYVEQYFPPQEKQRAQAMVRAILEAFGARIDRLEWMSPQTRLKAKAKLATLKVSVGYPDAWRDYSGLKIVRGDALGNAERGEQFEYRRNLAKLGAKVDRDEWVMTPQTVNAVNLPVMNSINLPAAILQPPYFDPHRPAVMDFGAIGSLIGHEVSHSFDDQGALFDEEGRLRNWWTPEDLAHFEAASRRLAAQYDGYHPFPDLAVNGEQTLSENLADVAGLAAAYDAWRLTLHGAPAPQVGDFSGEQLFFLSFAQSWRQKVREPALRQRIVTDGHAPAQYRADTVRNLDPWYTAFDVKKGEALYLEPKDRVRVW
jgi:predicted metalloendopeptidase